MTVDPDTTSLVAETIRQVGRFLDRHQLAVLVLTSIALWLWIVRVFLKPRA